MRSISASITQGGDVCHAAVRGFECNHLPGAARMHVYRNLDFLMLARAKPNSTRPSTSTKATPRPRKRPPNLSLRMRRYLAGPSQLRQECSQLPARPDPLTRLARKITHTISANTIMRSP